MQKDNPFYKQMYYETFILFGWRQKSRAFNMSEVMSLCQ